MFFLKAYFYKILKHDLINTFYYQNLIQVPKIKKMVLNFGYQKSSFKYLISSLLALEFLSGKKGKITKSKHLNVFLKIKKGNPVGCKIVLRKAPMYFFYVKLKACLYSKTKHHQIPLVRQNLKQTNSLTFQLKTPLTFSELETQFQFFKHIPKLDVTIVTSSKSQKELTFLLKSIKFFL